MELSFSIFLDEARAQKGTYMEVENVLAKNITVAGDKAALDAACKRLLANKVILAWIMKSCMDEYRDYPVDEIAEKYIEGMPQIGQVAVHPDETNLSDAELIHGMSTEDVTLTEGKVTYDIRFLAVTPKSGELIRLIINIETQNDFYPGYPLIKRGIYYCSRMISAQYGTEFTDSHYENIKKVYSVWICINPPTSRENTITEYSIHEKNLVGNVTEKAENYDLMTAIMICLGNPDDGNYEGILKLLEVLLSSDRKPEEKKQILRDDFGIKMTKSLESEVWNMCNISEGVERKGIEKGIAESIRNIMDSLKMTMEQAMDVLKVPEGERQKYMDLLK